MEEGEKKPDAGTISGSPQKKIVYAVLAVAVVILAVILVAKFGYNTDLLNPTGGQMSLVQRQPVGVQVAGVTTGVTTTVTPTTGQQPPRGMTLAPAYAKATLNPVSVSPCTADQTYCSGVCADLQTDQNNCGACGHVCSRSYHVVNSGCGNSQCKTLLCEAYYADDDGKYDNGCEHYWGPGTPGNPSGIDLSGLGSSSSTSGDVGDDYDTSDNGCNVYGAADCDGIASNGCETQTYGDINNCGKCGQKCTGPANTVGTMCSNFKCTNQPGSDLACKAGWGDCDGIYSNGCENDLRSNSDCGACGHWCGFPEHCFWDPNYPTLNHCGI